MNYLQTALILASLGALTGRAAEPGVATNEEPAAARAYTNTVQLYNVDLGIDGPRHKSDGEPARPDQSYDALSDQSVMNPTVIPAAPARRMTTKKDTDRERKSGWGWLADDVQKSEKKDAKENPNPDEAADKDANTDDRGDKQADGNESNDRDSGHRTGANDSKKSKTVYFMDAAFTPDTSHHADSDRERDAKSEARQKEAGPDKQMSDEMKKEMSLDANGSSGWLVQPGSESAAASATPATEDSAYHATTIDPAVSSPTVIPGDALSLDSLSPSFGLHNGAVDTSAGVIDSGSSAQQAGSDSSGSGSARLNIDVGSDSVPGTTAGQREDSFGGMDDRQPKVLPW